MLYLRPALKYFCSLPLHDDFIYDADSSFINKVEIKTQIKTQCEFSFISLSSFEKMFVSLSPLAPPLPPPRPVAHSLAVRYTLIFT